MRNRGALVVLALALGVAAWLRARGLAFGLPAVYNPDEIAIMSRALAFAKGDLNPHNFLYPTLYFYVLFGWEALYFFAGFALRAIPSLAAFQASFFLNPTGIYLAGRALGVGCGVATVLVTWRLGTRAADGLVGGVAAVFLAVAPFAVRDAHYVKHDVPVTLLIVLAVAASERLMASGTADRVRWLWAGGLLAGLATSTHYYAVFTGLPLAFAAWTAWPEQPFPSRAGRVVQAGVVAAAAFFLGSPFLLVEPATALRDIRANRQIVVDRALETSGRAFASAPEYLRMLWWDAMGWPVVLLALAGALVLARRRPRMAALLLAFPVAFLVFISNTVAATRYLNSVLPFVAVLAGVGAIQAGAWLSRGRTRVAAVVAVAGLATWPGLKASWYTGSFFRQTDTRTLGLDFLRTHVPAGSGVLVQPYSVPVPESRQSLIDALTANLGDPSKAPTKFQLRLGLSDWPDPAYRVTYLGHGGLDADKIYLDYPDLGGAAGLSALARRDVHYVVLKRYNDESAVVAPLVEALGREGRRVVEISPYRTPADAATVRPFLHNTDARLDAALVRPGPVIEIWQLP